MNAAPSPSRLERIARRRRSVPEHVSDDVAGGVSDGVADGMAGGVGDGVAADVAGRVADDERCELCAAPVPPEHPHLLDLGTQQLRCTCRACAVLFDHRGAGGGQLRRVPDRRWRLPVGDDDALLAAAGVPVDLAFFVPDGDGGATAYYPGAAGVVRAAVGADVWSLDAVTAGIEPHVEALLVRHPRGGKEQRFLVPVDDCFRLAGVVRASWQGWTGGEVWGAVAAFFDALARRARPARMDALPGGQIAGGRERS